MLFFLNFYFVIIRAVSDNGYKGEGHYRGLLKRVKGKYSQIKHRAMVVWLSYVIFNEILVDLVLKKDSYLTPSTVQWT